MQPTGSAFCSGLKLDSADGAEVNGQVGLVMTNDMQAILCKVGRYGKTCHAIA